MIPIQINWTYGVISLDSSEINLIFDSASSPIILDDTIPVSLFDEELVDENGLISVKKVWDVSQKTIKPKIFLCRKIYDADDFVMLSEKELRTLCAKFHIGDIFADLSDDFQNLIESFHNRVAVGFRRKDAMTEWWVYTSM